MEVKAKLRHLKISPTKVRLVADLIRGLTVEEAEYQLSFVNKRAVPHIIKLLKSAIANAENNNKLKREDLYIKRIFVNQGPTLKRWRARAFGRAAMIRKRSSHITLVLDEVKNKKRDNVKTAVKSEVKKKPGRQAKEDQKVVDYNEVKHESKFKKGEEAEKDSEGVKKPVTGFKSIKDKFTRRLGEK